MIPRKHLVYDATRWRDELLGGLPDALLRWFACDCAERACAIAAVHQPILIQAIELGRQHALGVVDDAALREMWSHIPTYQWRNAWRAVRNALYPGCLDAAIETSHAAWGAIMKATESDLGKDQSRCPERLWQLARLHYLADVWITCGQRSAQLLYDGLCPILWSDFLEAYNAR